MKAFLKSLIKAAIVMALAVVLAGCSVTAGDITALMNPPKLTAEQQAIEQALKTAAGANFTLKYPLDGDYRSSFILHDLNGDTQKEALAFYCPANVKSGTYVMIFQKNKGIWQEIRNIYEDGSDVNTIAFGDIDGDGWDDIAIGWTLFTGTNMDLGIYSLRNNFNKINIGFTKMMLADLNGDGKKEVLLVKLDSAAKEAKATLVGYKYGRLAQLDETALDGTVSKYAGFSVTRSDDRDVVLIDGYKGSNMVTELVGYKDDNLYTPFNDGRTRIARTLRDVPLTCEDIDSDGAVEVPQATELPGYTSLNTRYSKKIWLITWNTFKDAALEPKFSCVLNSNAGYYFIYPDNWKQKITVERNPDDLRWKFRCWDAENKKMGEALFEILVYSKNDWNNDQLRSSRGSYELYDTGSAVYVVNIMDKQASTAPYYLDIAQIKRNFRLLR